VDKIGKRNIIVCLANNVDAEHIVFEKYSRIYSYHTFFCFYSVVPSISSILESFTRVDVIFCIFLTYNKTLVDFSFKMLAHLIITIILLPYFCQYIGFDNCDKPIKVDKDFQFNIFLQKSDLVWYFNRDLWQKRH